MHDMSSPLDAIGRRQHGLVTSGQLADLGFTRKQARVLLASGSLVGVRRGVCRLCGTQPSWHSIALAAGLVAGDEAVLSHRSAGVRWGFLDRHDEGAGLELIVPGQRRLTGVRAG